MISSPFPGMDPFLEINPWWELLHGWFIRELARQSMSPARDLGCQVDVERSVYGREPTGAVFLLGEPDLVAQQAPEFGLENWQRGQSGVAVAEPRAIHEVVLDPDQMHQHKQQYMVVRESGDYARVLAVVELLSPANKQGSYAPKYREKRARLLSSMIHFMEIDFLRDGENPSRELFPELPRTPYFIFVARKTGLGRHEEGYPLGLQDPLPVIGLPLGPGRPDLPLDLAAAFRSAYDLSYRPAWQRDYQAGRVPAPSLDDEDREWAARTLETYCRAHGKRQ